MKSAARIIIFAALFIGAVAFAQQPSQPQALDPNAPSLSLDEKITLGLDDIKKTDVLEKLQKEYIEEIKPIQDHQDAAKVVIEKDHPGWSLVFNQQGWHFEKKPEPPKTEAKKPAEAPKK